jgi:L-arabinose isomerase
MDGILVIHLSMGITEMLKEVIACQRPTMLFAAPYSGHEWTAFGALRKQPGGELFDCFLTSDYHQLATAIRPIRALHHLREAKIINVSARQPSENFLKAIAAKFGTQIKTIGLEPMMEVYNSIANERAEAETELWMKQAEKIVEPPRDEILHSCKLALAFEKVLEQEEATAITVDCYGSMYRKLPAFPCVGFVRLNNLGWGGICESDLTSAMTYVLLQGLSGKPGFISDPTMDESAQGIVLAHCLGTAKMDGPAGEAAPYRLRTIMERQEGCVPQVRMRVGQKVTQALLVGTEKVLYFTGEIVDAPLLDKGCRTKIVVKVDGDTDKLWQNWTHGLHRLTCYGNLVPDLKRFCRMTGLSLVNEA